MEMRVTQSKRHWAEEDWTVAMAAKSFVAIYADASPPEVSIPKKKTSSKRKTRTSAKKRAGARARATQVVGGQAKEQEEATASFWLAQLQDDVTAEMLEGHDVSVCVTWLSKKLNSDMVYELAYDEAVDVQTILCHVYLVELDDSTLELTAKSLARINRSVERTRNCSSDAIAVEDEEDDETVPRSRKPKRQVQSNEGGSDGEERNSRPPRGPSGRGNSSKKRKTGNSDIQILPHYTTVPLDKYEDREFFGQHTEEMSSKNDPRAAAIEVIRAVLTKNYELLKHLTTTESAYKNIHSFGATRSADVKKSAFQYAIEANDVTAVSMLLKARSISAKKRIALPEFSLPSHSTGEHTSPYSDYNRRAINASRGGREGNNALLEDAQVSVKSEHEETSFFWTCKASTPQMLTVLFPTRNWGSEQKNPLKVQQAAHVGNYKLTAKLIEFLSLDGWGFNDLHLKVLSDKDEPLPVFRSASVVKMAQQTRVRPLHLAAINPNAKYLQALWNAIKDEVRSAKDTTGYEPIHYAAVCESNGPMKFLLEQGQDLFTRTKDRHSPMMRALIVGREETAIFMLEHAAKDEAMLRKLITDRGPSSYQAIHFAAENGCARVIDKLISLGADINSLAGDKSSALLLAAKNGHIDCVKILLGHQAKVDLANKLNKTPLMMAVKNGNTRVAALLINNGANVNACDSSQNSVAHYAASYGWLSCVELLSDAAADFWSKNSWGFVPLSCALLKRRTLCTELLFERDTARRFLDFRDRQGCTLLFLECQHCESIDQIEYLLKKGQSPNIGNSRNTYPLQILLSRASLKDEEGQRKSSQSFYDQAIRLLLQHGALAQLEHLDKTSTRHPDVLIDYQPLHLAIMGEQRDIFMLLLNEFNTDPCATSSNGFDAWLTAATMGANGDFFLHALLDHHAKSNPGKPINFTGQLEASVGVNFFHIISRRRTNDLVSADIIQRCIAHCANPSMLFNAKDQFGQSPLIQLLANRRFTNYWHQHSGTATNICENALNTIKASDRNYSDLVALFSEYTTDPEACIIYQGSRNTAQSAFGATQYTEAQVMEQRLVKYQTVLHFAASHKIMQNASALNKWYGSNLISILLEKCAALSESTGIIDFPDRSNHKTPLLYAVESNDLQGAHLLLERGANVNHSPIVCADCKELSYEVETSCECRKELWETPLITAVHQGDTSIACLLLKHGASVSCLNLTRDSPLHLAFDANNGVLTCVLLDHGANLIEKRNTGDTALHCAIQMNRSVSSKEPHEGEVVYTEFRNDKSSTQASESFQVIKNLSAIDAALLHPHAKYAVEVEDIIGRTPIHLAAGKRDIQLLKALVKVAANPATSVNARDKQERTPLHYAINAASMSSDESFEIERFLLACGADVNAVDMFKMSALHFALLKVDLNPKSRNDDQPKKLSVGSHAIEAENNDGIVNEEEQMKMFRTTLAEIPEVETDPVETVSNLVSVLGINTIQQDILGRSPLHLAGATGAFVCASLLLSKFSNANAKQKALKLQDEDGFTPLGRAVEHLRQTTIMTLLQNDADVSGKMRLKKGTESQDDTSSKEQWRYANHSYFYYAVQHSMTGICHMLLSSKFSRHQALEDAIRCGQFQLATNLISATEVVNDSTIVTRANDDGDTLLHILAKVNMPFDEIARTMAWTMIDTGVSATQCNRKGNSALHYAARTGNIHLMDFLLHNQCGLNQTNDDGESPLIFMLKKSKRPSDDILGALEYMTNKNDIDLSIVDSSGMNALTAFLDRITDFMDDHVTCFKWIETLLEMGVSPNELFTSRSREVFSVKTALPQDSQNVQIPALIRLVYIPSPYVRFHAIAVLLRYGAKITVTDSLGNSLLMHLLVKNYYQIAQLVLGNTPLIPDVVDSQEKHFHKVNIPDQDVQSAVAQINQAGQTPLHTAVKSHVYASFENGAMVELLLNVGADPHARDCSGKSVLDYARGQSSHFMFRLMKKCIPHVVHESEEIFFKNGDNDDLWMEVSPQPDSSADADAYLRDCEVSKKITRETIVPRVHRNCNCNGRVYSPSVVKRSSDENMECDDEQKQPSATGEELDVLLTKVDVRNGRFGLNVFYRMQLAHDDVEGRFVLFTNWGRIGERSQFQSNQSRFGGRIGKRSQFQSNQFRVGGRVGEGGKFQNTPFQSEKEAVQEFLKIFRSKTGNHWEDRHEFVKQNGKYNLVQRVNVHTILDSSIMAPILDAPTSVTFPDIRSTECSEPSVVEMLTAITDIRNLQLAATQTCDYHDDLPLAKEHELRAAVTKLVKIRDSIEVRNKVSDEIQNASAQLIAENSNALSDLSAKHCELTEQISELSSRYYEVMPCNENSFGHSICAFDKIEDVNKEITRLRMLISIAQTYQILLGAKYHRKSIHPLEYCFNALQVRVSPLAVTSEESKLISTYFQNGIRNDSRRQYRISKIFNIDRRGETERFQDYVGKHESMRSSHSELLWHGTKRTNLMGILSQGLRIAPPEAPHHGYAYGKGLYFANVAAKSLDYCDLPYTIAGNSQSSDSGRQVHYLLLCEVALGNSTILSSQMDYEKVPANMESVRVLAENSPDPSESMVSPVSGVKVPLGPIGRVSMVPFDKIWVKTVRSPFNWQEGDPKFTLQIQDFLDNLVDKLHEGETYEVKSDTEKELFVKDNTICDTITVLVVEKQFAGLNVAPMPAKSDVTVKITIDDYSYHAKRYRQATTESKLDDGYTMGRERYNEYAELIVYNEAQARIRYLVEVEQLVSREMPFSSPFGS